MLRRHSLLSFIACLGLFGSFIDDPNNGGGGSNNEDPDNGSDNNDGGKTVTMSQADLDTLINKKYAKATEKANSKLLEDLGLESIDDLKTVVKSHKENEDKNKSELEKANETINTLNTTIESLTSKLSKSESDSKLNKLAADYGITEVDYFKYEYNKASKAEDFDESLFMENLLKDKGSILKAGENNGQQNRNVGNPSNKQNNQDNQGDTITMTAYSQLSAEDRKKYKSEQIVRG